MSFTESSSCSSDSRDEGPVSIFWGCELSGAKSSYTFHVPEDWNCEQQLVLRTICLGETARDEFHVVEVATGDGRTPVPLATLKPSVLPTATLAGIELNPPVTFRLRAGSGPVYISGQHVSLMLLSSDEEDEGEEEEMEEPPKKPPKGAQRSSTARGRKPEKEDELRRNLGPKAPVHSKGRGAGRGRKAAPKK